jgi:hypothetical protein
LLVVLQKEHNFLLVVDYLRLWGHLLLWELWFIEVPWLQLDWF